MVGVEAFAANEDGRGAGLFLKVLSHGLADNIPGCGIVINQVLHPAHATNHSRTDPFPKVMCIDKVVHGNMPPYTLTLVTRHMTSHHPPKRDDAPVMRD